MKEDAARFIAFYSVDLEAVLEGHLMNIMFLARQVPGISYDAAMHWPPWKVASRMRHARLWLEAEEKATADSMKAAR